MESIGELSVNIDSKPLNETNQNVQKQSPKSQESSQESTQEQQQQQQQQQPEQQMTSLSSLGDGSAKISKTASLGYDLSSPVLPIKTASNIVPICGNVNSSAGKTNATPAVAAVAFIGTSMANEHAQQRAHEQHLQQQHQHQEVQQQKPLTLLEQNNAFISPVRGSCSSISSQQQTIEKLSRPLAFDKMEALVREMQDTENGVPVRQQKIFLTSIPYAFMGYDLIEWLMDRLLIEESEALNIANQLCLHGYFFPVNDTKSLTVKDDSSLYRFQTPYYWPWQHKAPDNVEYAIYLTKRSLRNKQRHALEDYEAEALQSLHKNLKGKWDFISMQAEEQVRLAKERKKGDKIVGDSQERAYWRVHRPPPGQFTPLEPCPVPSRDRQGGKTNKKKSIEDIQREVDYLKRSLNRTRMKMSQACESLVAYSETFVEYDFFLQPVLPSNPWVTEDITFWQLNNTFVDIPTEKRVKRWAISIEELVSDPTGLQEFTSFLEKEYSHENIRFWIAVNLLRRSAHSQVPWKVNEIYEEFLKPGAPCEINIDSKTMECVLKGLKNPSRFTFDSASEHIYMLLLKKDCYPRFIRSDHYKRLLETGIQPSHKKRFFNFSAVSGAKKKMTAALSNQAADPPSTALGTGKMQGANMNNNINMSLTMTHTPSTSSNLVRRRGSDRSLTGSAHELTVIGLTKDTTNKVPHSHSQSNLSEIPFRDISKVKPVRLETTVEQSSSAICPWDVSEQTATAQIVLPEKHEKSSVQLSVCPWEQQNETEIVAKPEWPDERIPRISAIRHQNTVDSAEACKKMLLPTSSEQRRASVSFISSHTSEEPSSGSLGLRTDNIKSTQNIKILPTSENFDDVFEETILPETHMEKAKINLAQSKEQQCLEGLTNKPLLLKTQNSAECSNENPKDIIRTSLTNLATKELSSLGQTVQEVQIELIEGLPCLDKTKTKANIDKIDVVAISADMSTHSKKHVSSSSDIPLSLLNAQNSQIINEKLEKLDVQDMQLLQSRDVNNTEGKSENETNEEYVIPAEELSPTSDEYQEGSQFGETKNDMCSYEMTENEFNVEAGGYIPPAPTPAPSLAPLAELDLDNVEDDLLYEEVTPILPTLEPKVNILVPIEQKQQQQQQQQPYNTNEETKKRRKKRNLASKNINAVSDEKETTGAAGILNIVKDNEEKVNSTEQNTVCPWEDENNSASGGTFVKTYATLGYL